MTGGINFNKKDRVLIMAPHPDDEVIACGGIIQEALSAGASVHEVFLTYGDNNEWSFLLYRNHPVVAPSAVRAMGEIRYTEAHEADEELGVKAEDMMFLGYPDFRTLAIWESHWADSPPEESMFTRVRHVPYENALRPGAPYKGEEILADIKAVLGKVNPSKIFVSHSGDHNPDHVSLNLFTRIALWDLKNEMAPEVHPYLVHRAHWPVPVGLHSEMPINKPDLFEQNIDWVENELSSDCIRKKHRAIEKHRTQFDYSSDLLLAFVRKTEIFGDFSDIVLKKDSGVLSLSDNRKDFLVKINEDLTQEERALFIGIEEHFVELKGDVLSLELKFSKPLGEEVGVSSFIFGYRHDKDFVGMPKVHVKFGALKHKVYDGLKKLPLNSVNVTRQVKGFTIEIPLEVLSRPERILLSTRIYMGDVPLDYAPWRVVTIK